MTPVVIPRRSDYPFPVESIVASRFLRARSASTVDPQHGGPHQGPEPLLHGTGCM